MTSISPEELTKEKIEDPNEISNKIRDEILSQIDYIKISKLKVENLSDYENYRETGRNIAELSDKQINFLRTIQINFKGISFNKIEKEVEYLDEIFGDLKGTQYERLETLENLIPKLRKREIQFLKDIMNPLSSSKAIEEQSSQIDKDIYKHRVISKNGTYSLKNEKYYLTKKEFSGQTIKIKEIDDYCFEIYDENGIKIKTETIKKTKITPKKTNNILRRKKKINSINKLKHPLGDFFEIYSEDGEHKQKGKQKNKKIRN